MAKHKLSPILLYRLHFICEAHYTIADLTRVEICDWIECQCVCFTVPIYHHVITVCGIFLGSLRRVKYSPAEMAVLSGRGGAQMMFRWAGVNFLSLQM